MAVQYLQCPKCFTILNNPFVPGPFSREYVATDCKVTCPKCGNMVLAPDIHYKDGIEYILSGPAFTPQVLVNFSTLIIQTQLQNYSPEKFTAEAEKISPAAGGLARFFAKNPTELAAYLAIALTIISTLLSVFKQDAPTTTNNYYSTTMPTAAPAPAPAQVKEVPAKRGSNYTPPKKKKRRK